MRTRPTVALIAASLMAVSLAACGSDEPAAEPTEASNATSSSSPTEGGEQAAYFEGLPRFKFSAELDCASLEPLDLTPLAQRMSLGEPLEFYPHGNIAGETRCNWATEMSDSFGFKTGPSAFIVGDIERDGNLSDCYEAQAPSNRIETDGKFTAAWAYSDGYCTGGTALMAVALSEDGQSASVCTFSAEARNTDMGQEPIVDLKDDAEGRKIFVQLCAEAFDSIKS